MNLKHIIIIVEKVLNFKHIKDIVRGWTVRPEYETHMKQETVITRYAVE